MSRIILASGSPRRKEILENMGLEFEILPAKGEEVIRSTVPSEVVEELSRQKAMEVAGEVQRYNEEHPDITSPQDILVIGADTVVACDDQILGKPKDEEDAVRMLTMLQGRSHQVYTGVTLVFLSAEGKAGAHTFHDATEVMVYPMTETEIRRYVATGEPMDKAGAYGIQGRFAIHTKGIRGDFQNVVGFPVARFYQELNALGIDIYLW